MAEKEAYGRLDGGITCYPPRMDLMVRMSSMISAL